MGLVVWLSLYLGGFAFFTYACIIADPDTSTVANILTVKLPGYIGSGLRRFFGPKVMASLETATEFGLVLAYLVIVLGCWSIMFTFGYDLVTSSSHVSNVHKYCGYVVFVACISSWRYASRTSPGIITARTLAKFDNYPYDDLLFHDKICPTVKIRKLARSKYDRFSGKHIPRFDHFCGWINNAVGEENYRWFLLFLAVHVGMCFYGSIVTYWLFMGEVADGDLLNATFFVVETGEEVKASKFVVAQFLFARHFYLSATFIVMAIMAIALSLFLGFHLYISARGMTTNEHYKWKQVRKWHKRAKKRYEEAKKKGLLGKEEIAAAKTMTAASVSEDVDVGCAGPTNTSSSEEDAAAKVERSGKPADGEDEDNEAILDPGPYPKNIYDRGIKENIGEIIYPRSLREDAVARWRESLQKKGIKESAAVTDAVMKDKPKVI